MEPGCFANPNAIIPDRSNVLSTAWAHLLETVAVKGVATKAITTVAEMSRTRYNGSLTKTGSDVLANDNQGIRLAPYVLGAAVASQIRGHALTDLNVPLAGGWAAIEPHLTQLTCWRSTPLGLMHKSCVWVGDGAEHQDHRTYAAGWVDYTPEYQLTECNMVNRILIARDVFMHSESCRSYLFRSTACLMVFVSETAALVGGVSTWMYTYYGMTLSTVNRLVPSDRNVPYHQHELLSGATNCLVIPVFGQVWTPYSIADLRATLREVMPWAEFTYGMWRSLPLPWWLASAISEKYGLVYKISTPVAEICTSNDYDNDDWRQGYAIDSNTMWATLPMLTSDDRYISNGTYRIMLYRSRAYDEDTWLAWQSDLCYDSLVQVQCSPVATPPTQPMNVTEVNILTVPFLQDNTLRDRAGPICFVNCSTPNNMHDRLHLENKIRFPDPIMDHLIKAGKAALPELAVGNVPGAIKTALLSAADPAINWALEQAANLTGVELFRPST